MLIRFAEMLVMPDFMHTVCRLHLESDDENSVKHLLKVVMNIHGHSYHHLLNASLCFKWPGDRLL